MLRQMFSVYSKTTGRDIETAEKTQFLDKTVNVENIRTGIKAT